MTDTADAGDACADWAGVLHRPTQSPPRIACLVPSITELLFALSLDDHVVARTGFCRHPRDRVRRVAKIGGTKDPDLGRLASLAPTHLVVNVDENRREDVDAARAFVPHIVVTHPLTPADNLRLYRLLGCVFARDDAAHALSDAFAAARARLRDAAAALPRERVLYLIWRKPWMTVSPGTYIAATLAAAGWDIVSPPSDARYPVVTDDDACWQRADRILLASEPFAFRDRDARAVAAQYARPAMRLDAEMTSWYGSRAIAGMDYLAKLRRDLAGTTA